MVGRAWVGLVMVVLAVVGLVAGRRIDGNGGNAATLAVLSVVVLAAGVLLTASASGEVAVRIAGSLLFLAGVAVAVTNHEVWWWLPSNWQTPVSLAALAIALVGLGVLLFAYGFSLAGLSGALGLLAVTALGLTLLPYIGSEEQSVFRAIGTAFGAVAFVAGVGAATGRGTRKTRRPVTAVAGAVAAVITGYAGYDSYDTYAPAGFHAAVIGAAVTGVVASLSLATLISWPGLAGRLPRSHAGRTAPPETVAPTPAPAQAHEPPLRSASAQPTPEAADPVPPAQPVAPSVVATQPTSAGTASAAAAPAAASRSRLHDRLQTASLGVGLVIGIITIAKELIAAALTMVR